MLKMTNDGKCMAGTAAIEFFEKLPDLINNNLKTDEFREKYEDALNRFRYEVAKSVPVRPNVLKAYARGHKDFITCGACGFSLDLTIYQYCPNCGKLISKSR